MKDKSLELDQIVNEVRNELGNKVKILQDNDQFNSHTQGFVNNINKRITDLDSYTEEINKIYNSNPDILINFKKRATEIWEEINELK
jgi:hypothetical protein